MDHHPPTAAAAAAEPESYEDDLPFLALFCYTMVAGFVCFSFAIAWLIPTPEHIWLNVAVKGSVILVFLIVGGIAAWAYGSDFAFGVLEYMHERYGPDNPQTSPSTSQRIRAGINGVFHKMCASFVGPETSPPTSQGQSVPEGEQHIARDFENPTTSTARDEQVPPVTATASEEPEKQIDNDGEGIETADQLQKRIDKGKAILTGDEPEKRIDRGNRGPGVRMN